MKKFFVFLIIMPYSAALFAALPDVEIADLSGNPVKIPYLGEKNLLIFYVDPDEPKQNNEFTLELEANQKAVGPEMFAFGILNLKDAPLLPNFIVLSMAKRRTTENKALVLADRDRIISKNWKLGNCNNKFVIMIISKSKEFVFVRKGILSEKDKEEFYKIIPFYTGK